MVPDQRIASIARFRRANPHFGVSAIQGNLEVKAEIHTLASNLADCQNLQSRDDGKRGLVLRVGLFAAIASDYAARSYPVKFMVNATYGRMGWVVASAAPKKQ